MIEIRQFTKLYDQFEAVHGLSLDIEQGDIFGIIGPNGAGKTTTFRFLATLLLPTSGRATLAGFDVVRQVREVRRSMGYMPDSYGVYYGMRVWEFLDFFAASYGVPRAKRRRVIDDLLQLLDLGHKRDDAVQALSRGMRQRLCLAKTLVHDPPVLILDEPASGLDPRARIEIKELLKELRRLGKTILISSHILQELADVCTKVAFLERGRLLAAGDLDVILAQIRRHHILEIRVVGDGAKIIEEIVGAHPSVLNLRHDEGVWVVDFTGGDEEQARLLGELVARGVAVREFHQRRVNLEEAFIKITKGEVI
ncbi:MAG: ABC transporter ATP-binding protein [Candidatus Sumerlaeia bacterium]|nr:ABC transporter ATP-binding protein [Candidatus Sumerlaeia bacterium]